MSDEQNSPKAGACESTLFCPGCLEAVDPWADFCRACGIPLSVLATIDPLKRTVALGWMCRRAIAAQPKRIVTVGMFLIFGPDALWMLAAVVDMLRWPLWWDSILGLPLGALVAGIYCAVLYRLVQRHYRFQRFKQGYCETCGYNLRGLPSPRCPECGTPFDPNEIKAPTEP